MRLLPIPYLLALTAGYLRASLSHEDYPNMISAGQRYRHRRRRSVLIAYNWPKNTDHYQRVQRFVDVFFPRIADFRRLPPHPKYSRNHSRSDIRRLGSFRVPLRFGSKPTKSEQVSRPTSFAERYKRSRGPGRCRPCYFSSLWNGDDLQDVSSSGSGQDSPTRPLLARAPNCRAI